RRLRSMRLFMEYSRRNCATSNHRATKPRRPDRMIIKEPAGRHHRRACRTAPSPDLSGIGCLLASFAVRLVPGEQPGLGLDGDGTADSFRAWSEICSCHLQSRVACLL